MKKQLPALNVKIDGLAFNGRHYAKFDKKEGVERMVKDNKDNELFDPKKAGEYYDEIKKRVTEFDDGNKKAQEEAASKLAASNGATVDKK